MYQWGSLWEIKGTLIQIKDIKNKFRNLGAAERFSRDKQSYGWLWLGFSIRQRVRNEFVSTLSWNTIGCRVRIMTFPQSLAVWQWAFESSYLWHSSTSLSSYLVPRKSLQVRKWSNWQACLTCLCLVWENTTRFTNILEQKSPKYY